MTINAMRRAAMVFAALFFAAPAFGAETLATPEAAAKAFYRVYARAHVLDIPDTKHQAVWKPVLSDNLIRLIVLGDEGEARWADKNKKEPSPPLFEGDLFSSMVEGGAKFDGAVCETKGDAAECMIALHVIDKSKEGKRETFSWHDKLYLVLTPAGWRVDDLAYGGTWEFKPKGKMSDQLKWVDQESRKNY